MTRRRANCLLIVSMVLFFLIPVAAFFLTWKNRTKPSVFVPPAIWRELHTGGEPPLQFDI